MLKFQHLSTNNKGAMKTSKRLDNCHNYEKLRHWAQNCKKHASLKNEKIATKEKDNLNNNMKNMLKDKESHIVNFLFDDKNKGPKEEESYEDTINLFEIVVAPRGRTNKKDYLVH
jgi:hypothetical protein